MVVFDVNGREPKTNEAALAAPLPSSYARYACPYAAAGRASNRDATAAQNALRHAYHRWWCHLPLQHLPLSRAAGCQRQHEQQRAKAPAVLDQLRAHLPPAVPGQRASIPDRRLPAVQSAATDGTDACAGAHYVFFARVHCFARTGARHQASLENS